MDMSSRPVELSIGKTSYRLMRLETVQIEGIWAKRNWGLAAKNEKITGNRLKIRRRKSSQVENRGVFNRGLGGEALG